MNSSTCSRVLSVEIARLSQVLLMINLVCYLPFIKKTIIFLLHCSQYLCMFFFSNYDKLEIDAAKSNTVPSQFVKTFNGNKNCFQELRGWRNVGGGGGGGGGEIQSSTIQKESFEKQC